MATKRLPPTEEEVMFACNLLGSFIPIDSPLRYSLHRSMKGNTAIRIMGITREIEWFVDMYRGPWFYISVPRFEPTTADNPMTLLVKLGVMLKGGA